MTEKLISLFSDSRTSRASQSISFGQEQMGGFRYELREFQAKHSLSEHSQLLGLGWQYQGSGYPEHIRSKSHLNYTNSIIKNNIIFFERPKILQECSNQSARNKNVFLAIDMKSIPWISCQVKWFLENLWWPLPGTWAGSDSQDGEEAVL